MRPGHSTSRALLILLTWLAGTAAHAEWVEVRSLEQELLLGSATQIQVKLSLGDVTVEGYDGQRVEIDLALDCDRKDMDVCKKRADRIQLAPRIRRGDLQVRLDRTSRARLRGVKARLKVRVPQSVPLEIDVTNGDIYVTGVDTHVNINSGAGDVDVLARRDRTASVNVDIGFGKADLWLGDGRVQGSGWPRSIDWRGSGQAEINVDVVGTGDVSVRLE